MGGYSNRERELDCEYVPKIGDTVRAVHKGKKSFDTTFEVTDVNNIYVWGGTGRTIMLVRNEFTITLIKSKPAFEFKDNDVILAPGFYPAVYISNRWMAVTYTGAMTESDAETISGRLRYVEQGRGRVMRGTSDITDVYKKHVQ